MPDAPTPSRHDELLAEADAWGVQHAPFPGDLMEALAAALRAQIAENERLRDVAIPYETEAELATRIRQLEGELEKLRDAQPAWREMVQAQQDEMDVLGRRLAEARAATPQPLCLAAVARNESGRLVVYADDVVDVRQGETVVVYRADQIADARGTSEQAISAPDLKARGPDNPAEAVAALIDAGVLQQVGWYDADLFPDYQLIQPERSDDEEQPVYRVVTDNQETPNGD